MLCPIRVYAQAAGMRDVIVSLCEEDDKRPMSFWATAPAAAPSLKERNYKKSGKAKGKMSRAASVKWFKEVESKKGSGIDDDGGFASWFHGIITRSDAEQLLTGKASGTFLIRVAESRFGCGKDFIILLICLGPPFLRIISPAPPLAPCDRLYEVPMRIGC